MQQSSDVTRRLVVDAIVEERKFIAVMTLAALAVGFISINVVQVAFAQTGVTTTIDAVSIAATAIAGIIGSVIAIASSVVTHIRQTTGNKYITDQANTSLQEVFKNGRMTDEWIRELVVQLNDNKAKLEAVTTAAKGLVGEEGAAKIDDALARAEKAVREQLNPELQNIDKELETIYKNAPLIGKSTSV